MDDFSSRNKKDLQELNDTSEMKRVDEVEIELWNEIRIKKNRKRNRRQFEAE